MGFLSKNGGLISSILGLGYQISKDQRLTGAEREANAFSASQADLSRQFEAQQADIARDWQEQQYLQYNSPAAMVRQYQEAGLNPALMYGSSSGSSASMSSPMPSSSAPGSVTPSGAGNIMEMFANLSMLQAQIRNLNADTHAKEGAARSSNASAVLQEIDSITRPLMNRLGIESAEAGIDNAKLDARLKEIEAEFKPQIFSQDLEKGNVNLEQLRLGCEKILLEMRQLDADTLLTLGNVDLQEYSKALMTAQTVAANAQGSLMSQESFEAAWRVQFMRDHNMDPNTNPASVLTQLAGLADNAFKRGISGIKSIFAGKK